MGNDEQYKEDAFKGEFTVDTFRHEDAEGMVSLFRKVYGEHYPIQLFYDPAAIIAANQEGRYHSIVARLVSGEVIGVNHLFPSAPYASLYESGVGLVLKEYRNSGANKRMLGFLFDTYVPLNPRIEETFGEAVCNHPYMQKAIRLFKHNETAIQVALMPAETYIKEKSAIGRVATLMVFRCYRSKPHRIFLPMVYENTLKWIYGLLDDTRNLDRSSEGIPPHTASRAEMHLFDYAQVARIAVHGIGEDFRSCISNRETEALAKKAVVFQVWLNMTEPWVGAAVDILREQGYFFGGPLPRWFDGDGLMMQKLACPPYFEGIVLESEFSKELFEVIKEDWRQVNPS
jgi:hypothetical protein